MFIVSRYRAPWVAFAFIAVVSIGAFMRFQQSAETDAKNLELDRAEFQLFKKDLAPINAREDDEFDSSFRAVPLRCSFY
jgi:membrane protein implicated in regulation of membrane protease activity